MNKLIISFILILLIISSSFLFYSYNNLNFINFELKKILDDTYKIYNLIDSKKQFVYKTLSNEKNAIKDTLLYETWYYDKQKEQLILETNSESYYSKTIFSKNLSLQYKETLNKEKLTMEKLILIEDNYIFQNYEKGKLKEEKKIRFKADDSLLIDTLPFIMRTMVINNIYEKIESIKLNINFIQHNVKVPLTLQINKSFKFNEFNFNIDSTYFNNIANEPYICFEIISPDYLSLFKIKTLYIFSLKNPLLQLMMYIGNKKNFFMLILNEYKNLD